MTIKTLMIRLALVCMGTAVMAEENWTPGGFDMPESTIFHSAREQIILSTIVDDLGEADGYDSLVIPTREGTVINPAWTTGLDAPKGMGIVGNIPLLTDWNRLHEVDLKTREVHRSHTLPGAVFLNGVTSDGNVAYLSDLLMDSIWRYPMRQIAFH